jgi:tetratricopeptide (TPR) repeat protein
MALNKIEIGDKNIKDPDLKTYSLKCADSGRSLWNAWVGEILDPLETQAKQLEETNYKLSVLYYGQVGEIYSLKGDSTTAEEYVDRQKKIEKKYEEALIDANSKKATADEKLRDARTKTFRVGRYYLVLNPLAYEFVSRGYEEAIKKYTEVEEIYTKAGEINDAHSVATELEILKGQKESIFIIFLSYGLFWTIIFVTIAARATLGFQHYVRDEREERIGEMFRGAESKLNRKRPK